MSKAAELRLKQAKESLINHMTRTLIGFQDKYLGAYTQWNIHQIELGLEKARDADGTIQERGHGKWKQSYRVDNTSLIAHIEAKLSRKHLLTLEFINEAKEGYDRKFDALIDKLMIHRDEESRFKVEKIGDAGHELSFLIVNDKVEVHARAIFVNGYIKAPHYRFITTTRAKGVKVEEKASKAPKASSRKAQVAELLEAGVTSPSEIAERLGTNASYVARLIKSM